MRQLVFSCLLDGLFFSNLNQFLLLTVLIGPQNSILFQEVGLEVLYFCQDLEVFGLLLVHGVLLVVERVVVLLGFLFLLRLLVLALANVDIFVCNRRLNFFQGLLVLFVALLGLQIHFLLGLHFASLLLDVLAKFVGLALKVLLLVFLIDNLLIGFSDEPSGVFNVINLFLDILLILCPGLI